MFSFIASCVIKLLKRIRYRRHKAMEVSNQTVKANLKFVNYHSLRSTSRSNFFIWFTLTRTSLSLSTRFLKLSTSTSSCFSPGASSFVNSVLLSISRFWISSYLKANSRWWEAWAGSELADVSVSSIILIACLYVSMCSWSSRLSVACSDRKFPFSFVACVNPWMPNPNYGEGKLDYLDFPK